MAFHVGKLCVRLRTPSCPLLAWTDIGLRRAVNILVRVCTATAPPATTEHESCKAQIGEASTWSRDRMMLLRLNPARESSVNG